MKANAPALTIVLLLGLLSAADGQNAFSPPPLSPSAILACGNGYHFNPADPFSLKLNGSFVFGNEAKFPVSKLNRKSDYHKMLRERWQNNESKLNKEFEKSGDFRHESDYALALLHNGSTAEALAIFQRLAAAHPEEYNLASNLGTAYELSGKNEEALHWIQKAMQLHPESHQGTEWLHEKILEVKIAGHSTTNALLDHSIAGVDFGKARKPYWPNALEDSPAEQERVVKALRYQLQERVQFVKPHDPVVAQMLFDLSSAVALQRTLGDAMEVSQLAMRYAEGDLLKKIQRRHKYYDLLTDRSTFGAVRRHPWLFIGLVLLGIFLALFILHRKQLEAALAEEKAQRVTTPSTDVPESPVVS